MTNLPAYIQAFQKLIPFKVRMKSESRWQRRLAAVIAWYIPTYLTHYVTIFGRTIYLPEHHSLDSPSGTLTMAHEVVHLLDQQRLTLPLFILLYISPQIFGLGVLLFPWLGWWACCFLIFVLPWPSPGRMYLEARAYGLEYYLFQQSFHGRDLSRWSAIFTSWDYYKMSWSRSLAERWINYYFDKAKNGSDPIFNQVVEVYNSIKK